MAQNIQEMLNWLGQMESGIGQLNQAQDEQTKLQFMTTLMFSIGPLVRSIYNSWHETCRQQDQVNLRVESSMNNMQQSQQQNYGGKNRQVSEMNAIQALHALGDDKT